jgi:hypothetical protein
LRLAQITQVVEGVAGGEVVGGVFAFGCLNDSHRVRFAG